MGATVSGAVIGCGAISKLHLASMKEAGIRIAAVCDTDAARAEQAKREWGDEATRVFADWRGMLREETVDIVAVLTPPGLHAEQTVAALRAGKWVYCEKPVAATLGGFDAIFEAEQASGRRAYFSPGRFRGAETPVIKQYVDAGDLGSVYRVESKHWRPRGRSGVDKGPPWFADSRLAIAGIMGDMGLYFMDRALYLTGWPAITSVSAVALREFPYEARPDLNYDVEEHVILLARTAGSLTFTFEFAAISYFDSWTTNTLMMLGTQGGMHLVNGRNEEFRFSTEKGGPGQFVHHRIEWKDKRKPDVVIYEQLASAARGQGSVTMGTSSREAFVLHEIMQMAFLSSRERREVRPGDLDHAAPIFLKP